MLPDKDRIVVKANAKINLFLEVIGKRPDGYHDLRSVVAPVDVSDSITLERIDSAIELSMDCSPLRCSATDNDCGWFAPVSEVENIAYKAAVLLKKSSKSPYGVKIGIKKCIPIGGGLGGGSSDAAAVLNGLNELWGAGMSVSELMSIGSELGSDVPAFVHGGMVLIEGVGERVTPLKISVGGREGWWLVLLNPGFPVMTGDIYSRYSPSLTSGSIPFSNMVCAVEKGDLRLAADSLYNSLQETVFRKYPLIAMVAEGLEKAGAAGVLLSGSGASVFGLAKDEDDAHRVAGAVEGVLGFAVWHKVARTCPMV